MSCTPVKVGVVLVAVLLLVLLIFFVVKWRKDRTRYPLLGVIVSIAALALVILGWFLLPGFIGCCDLGSTSLAIRAVDVVEEENPDADAVGTTTVEVTDGRSASMESCGLAILLLVRPTAEEDTDWQVSEPITEIADSGDWSGQIAVRTETIQPATSLDVVGIALTRNDARRAPSGVSDPSELNPAIESDIERVTLPPLVAVAEPAPGAEIVVAYEDGAAAVQVCGVSRAVAGSGDLQVVVLAKATQPASAGWWPFEAVDPDPDGGWCTQGFVGSAQVPVEEGHQFQVLALATDDDPADFETPIDAVGVLDPVVRSASVGFSIGTVEGRPDVTISKPEPDAVVSVDIIDDGAGRLQVLGASDHASGAQVVVLLHPTEPFASGWWPHAPAPVDDDGEWVAEVFLGSTDAPVETGQAFEILAALLPSDANAVDGAVADPSEVPSLALSDRVQFTVQVAEGLGSGSSTLDSNQSGSATPDTRRDSAFAVLASSLYVREAPTTTAGRVDEVPKGSQVRVACVGPGDPYRDPLDRWCTRWHRISAPTSGWVAAAFVDTRGQKMPDCQCVNPPVTLEAESAREAKGIENRDEAFGGFTVHLDEDTLEIPLNVCANVRAGFSIRYSNDNYNDEPAESIQVDMDAQAIGQIVAKDTGGGGLGWNVFEESRAMPVDLTAGPHRVAITVTGGDGGGVEIDALRVTTST
jgi:hypothetical protein